MKTWFTTSLCLLVLALCGCAKNSSTRPHAPAPSYASSSDESLGTDYGSASAPASSDGTSVTESSDYDGGYEAESAPSKSSARHARRESRRRTRDRGHAEDGYEHHHVDPSPGLGTEYGERRRSDSYSTRFARAHHDPDVALSLWYDDFDGVRAVADSSRRTSTLSDHDGAVTIALVDQRGRTLEARDAGHQRYAVGEPGQRYEIEVTNHTGQRFEVVASVDGLDVIDGDRASTEKRGYVLEPYAQLVIDGWRTAEDEVAAFRFGRVEHSYAERRGDGRNVGVIGVAFFHERGHDHGHRHHDHGHDHHHRDLERRRRARPFDDRFAPPPSW